jgi:Ca2+-binding RTX toxin-like protein
MERMATDAAHIARVLYAALGSERNAVGMEAIRRLGTTETGNRGWTEAAAVALVGVTLEGGDGDDILRGGNFDDTLSGHAGDDSLHGFNGDDQIDGGDGQDLLSGGDGNDILDGGADADRLIGGDGTDRLYGRLGNDHYDGGDGQDTAYIDAELSTAIFLRDDDGTLVVQTDQGVDTLDNVETITFSDQSVKTRDISASIQRVGSASNDVMEGGSSDEWLLGLEGDDWLSGGGGNDFIAGGEGSDTLSGGNGDDVLIPDADYTEIGHSNVGQDFQVGDCDELVFHDGGGAALLDEWAGLARAGLGAADAMPSADDPASLGDLHEPACLSVPGLLIDLFG